MAAEAERRRDRDRGLAADVQRLGLVGDVVEVHALLRLLESERRRGHPVAQREDRRDRLHGARGAEQVPDRGLQRGDRDLRTRGRRAPS